MATICMRVSRSHSRRDLSRGYPRRHAFLPLSVALVVERTCQCDAAATSTLFWKSFRRSPCGIGRARTSIRTRVLDSGAGKDRGGANKDEELFVSALYLVNTNPCCMERNPRSCGREIVESVRYYGRVSCGTKVTGRITTAARKTNPFSTTDLTNVLHPHHDGNWFFSEPAKHGILPSRHRFRLAGFADP